MNCCHKCGAPWVDTKKQPGPKEFCETCSAYLHCCLNCRYREPGRHNDCHIPDTDWVGDPAGANFCDQFEFADQESQKGQSQEAPSARDALNQLFGDDDDETPTSFGDLFSE